jgi:DNA modification methylase
MKEVEDESIDLIVTSPPYPMYDMWDSMFTNMNAEIGDCLKTKPMRAFELQHRELDRVWDECIRVLKDGCYLIINIADAPRSFNKDFQMFDNHSRIVSYVTNKGLKELPPIIWKKPTNSPNKFMGSFLPCNGFVTSEHEHILIFKKGTKRIFTDEERLSRRESAFFYEERNTWFSDTWNVVGASQKIDSETRDRSAAYPLEIPYRLISMFSIKGDTVLDPFGGLQTTSKAAMLLGRHSIGYELDKLLKPLIMVNLESAPTFNHLAHGRLLRHLDFIKNRECKYYNSNLNCNVVTNYETDIRLDTIQSIKSVEGDSLQYTVSYEPLITDIKHTEQ